MASYALTGSLIREKRMAAGVKQSELARQIGISATYLNLIEHNRRRIGGKLLGNIAEVLGVDTGVLSDGAEAETVAELRVFADQVSGGGRTLEPVEDLATRFPGWAGALVDSQRRIRDLERTVETLNDRMSHDPTLAASLHDVLTTASAIGSAASILAETKEIEAEWRDRFHRNIHEDSQRLAASSQSLVTYLEDAGKGDAQAQSPQDELESWLAECDHHIAGFERALPLSDEQLFNSGPGLRSREAQDAARTIFARYKRDALAMPLPEVEALIAKTGFDPVALSQTFGVSFATALRRMAQLPYHADRGRLGLVMCDHAGAVIYRKPIEGFAIPRQGAVCPLWPVFQSFQQTMMPNRVFVEALGRDNDRFLTYSVAEPLGPLSFDTPQVLVATMLIVPASEKAQSDTSAFKIGSTCRLCPRQDCAARRDASILASA